MGPAFVSREQCPPRSASVAHQKDGYALEYTFQLQMHRIWFTCSWNCAAVAVCTDPAGPQRRSVLITPHAYQSSYGYNTTPTQPAGQPQSQWQNQQGSTALASSDGNSTALKAKDQPKMVQVRFWLKFHVDYGQTVRIIGGHDQMGESQMLVMIDVRC